MLLLKELTLLFFRGVLCLTIKYNRLSSTLCYGQIIVKLLLNFPQISDIKIYISSYLKFNLNCPLEDIPIPIIYKLFYKKGIAQPIIKM